MEDRRPPNSVSIIAVLLLVVMVPLAVYILAYFALSRPVFTGADGTLLRGFRYQWQADIFEPAAKVESLVTKNDVGTCGP